MLSIELVMVNNQNHVSCFFIDTVGPSPRRSPRNKASSSTIDVFVHELSQDLKVSANADVLHKVSSDSSIEEIITMLQTYDSAEKVYIPSKGLYWLRKGSKQIVSLRKAEDLQTCKEEYKGNIRVACHAVIIHKSLG
jgi:hypothetical protein